MKVISRFKKVQFNGKNMLRYLMYCSSVAIAFFIGIFVVFSFHWKAAERFVNVQKGRQSNSAKVITQNQTNTSQDDVLPALEFNVLRVKGVGLGTPHSIVLRQLGKPLQSKKTGEYPCGDLEMTLRYSGLLIKLEKDIESRSYNVASIDITSAKWSVSGIA